MKKTTSLLIGVLILFMFLAGYVTGYLQKSSDIKAAIGISFNCNPYTSISLNRSGCNANISLPDKNISLIINSDYDEVKIVGSE